MIEKNKELIRLIVNEVWNKGQLDRIEQALAPNFSFYHPNLPEPIRGPAGYSQFVKAYRDAMPDLHITIDEMTAEDETVVYRWTFQGTHTGELNHAGTIAPATGHHIVFTGVTLAHVRDGRIHEDLMWSDAIGFRSQLGWVLEFRGSAAHP